MANVLNRVTRRFIKSANTPDYPVNEWIINPDMSAVINQPNRYWIITGDVVTLMDQAARDTVDANILTAADLADKVTEKKVFVNRKSMKALLTIIMGEFNILRAKHGLNDRTFAQLKSALDNEIDNQ